MANQGIKEDKHLESKTVLLYSEPGIAELLKGLRLAAVENADTTAESKGFTKEIDEFTVLSVSDKMYCSYCSVPFTDREDQTEHYKGDWHRFNLKHNLKDLPCVTEDEFMQMMEKDSDISSISGSGTDSESDEESEPRPSKSLANRKDSDDESMDSVHIEGIGRRHPRVFFKNKNDELLSIYRCVIHGKKNLPSSQEDLISKTTSLPTHMIWAVMMSSGGHFAAAIFENEKVLVHKTFHRYTVRAKRGTIQSVKDGQGNAPKSAGASLRRHNEVMLKEEIRGLLQSWNEHLKSCDRIFLRAPSINKSMFFGEKTSPLDKNDTRIRLIPFPTRRPTFKELQRVQALLATVECHGTGTSITDHIKLSPVKTQTAKQSTKAAKKTQRTQEIPRTDTDSSSDDSDNDDEETVLQTMVETLSTRDLKEFEVTRKPRRRKIKKKKVPTATLR